jgi:hypothetical protein
MKNRVFGRKSGEFNVRTGESRVHVFWTAVEETKAEDR